MSGKLLAGTKLIVRNFTTGKNVSLILDKNGGFEFDGLPGATYELAYQRDEIEEVLLVKDVEDVITEGYEDLGIFTIQEELSINIDEEHGEIEINGEMYRRISADGKFISEQGDTLTNIEMMDYLSTNMTGNSLEFNNSMYKIGIDGETYVQEDGTELSYDDLEELLISEIFANPLDLQDDSSLAGVDPRSIMLDPGVYKPANLNLKEVSALEWVNKALENDDLTKEQKIELSALQSSDLAEISAEDWLKIYANDPELSENLTEVEKRALGMNATSTLKDIASISGNNTTPAENLSENIPSYANELPAKLELENIRDYVIMSKLEIKSVLQNKNINNIYFDFDRSCINSNERKNLDEIAAVMIANPSLDMYVSAHTDARGSNAYNDALSEKRAKSVNAYLAARGVNTNRLKLGWYGEDELANSCTNEAVCEENAHRLNRRASFALYGEINSSEITVSSKTESSAPESAENNSNSLESSETNSAENSANSLEGLENIYFNFDKSGVRPDARVILNKVYNMMASNSESIIINAHTDVRGNNAYNDALSERRANEAKAFLISKGISANRIAINWAGESQLARTCENGKTWSSSDYQLNRRASLSWK